MRVGINHARHEEVSLAIDDLEIGTYYITFFTNPLNFSALDEDYCIGINLIFKTIKEVRFGKCIIFLLSQQLDGCA